MKKRILWVLLTLALCFSALGLAVSAESPRTFEGVTYPYASDATNDFLYIYEDSKTCYYKAGEGYAYWNRETATLTLNNATLSMNKLGVSSVSLKRTMTVRLIGENTILGPINAFKDFEEPLTLTFTGSGNLTAVYYQHAHVIMQSFNMMTNDEFICNLTDGGKLTALVSQGEQGYTVYGNYEVPEGVVLPVIYGSLTLAPGATLTNNGVIELHYWNRGGASVADVVALAKAGVKGNGTYYVYDEAADTLVGPYTIKDGRVLFGDAETAGFSVTADGVTTYYAPGSPLDLDQAGKDVTVTLMADLDLQNGTADSLNLGGSTLDAGGYTILLDAEDSITCGNDPSDALVWPAGYTTTVTEVNGVNVYAGARKQASTNYWLPVLARLYSTANPITAIAGEGGSISDEGSTSVKYGRSQTYTITPDEGYVIADVLVNGKSVGAVSEYTFKKVRRAQVIEVVFAPVVVEEAPVEDSADPMYSYVNP